MNYSENSVHFISQGKGGIGKSVVAVLLAQFLKDRGDRVVALDMDPQRASLATFARIEAESVEIQDGERANVAVLDDVLDRMCDEDASFVCDVGSGPFVSFNSWLLRDEVIQTIIDAGREAIFHVVIAGGPALVDTTLGLKAMIEQFPENAKFVVWTNPFLGELSHNGVAFEEGSFFRSIRDRLAGVVRLPELDPHYDGRAFRDLLIRRATFQEAIADKEVRRAERNRLAKIWNGIRTQLEEVL